MNSDEYEIKVLIGNYKDIQGMRIESENRITNFLRDKIAPLIHKKKDKYILEASAGVDWNSDILAMMIDKKYKKITEMIADTKISVPIKISNMVWFYNRLRENEKELYDIIDNFSRENIYRRIYLNNIRGIGAITSSGIIAYLSPLSRFNNPSKLWRYTGWGMDAICKKCGKMYFDKDTRDKWVEMLKKQKKDPDKYICFCNEPDVEYLPQKKRVGKLITYNPRLKDFFYVVVRNFIMNKRKSYYGRKYDVYKHEAMKKHSDWSEGHARMHAIRKIVKEFQVHLWMAWWFIVEKKEPPANPYVIDIMKHRDLTYPVVDVVEPPLTIKSIDDIDALYEVTGMRQRRK